MKKIFYFLTLAMFFFSFTGCSQKYLDTTGTILIGIPVVLLLGAKSGVDGMKREMSESDLRTKY